MALTRVPLPGGQILRFDWDDPAIDGQLFALARWCRMAQEALAAGEPEPPLPPALAAIVEAQADG